jgi:hypothetical protein
MLPPVGGPRVRIRLPPASDKAERDLGQPTLTSELKERLAAGITAETAGRGIAELAAWRDRFLVDLLALRAGQKYRAPNDHCSGRDQRSWETTWCHKHAAKVTIPKKWRWGRSNG